MVIENTPERSARDPRTAWSIHFAALADLLHEVFAHDFELWHRATLEDHSSEWRPVEGFAEFHPTQEVKSTSGPSCNQEFFDKASSSACPRVSAINPESFLLAVPVALPNRQSALAVATFKTQSPELLTQLACSFLDRWQLQSEVKRLADENNSLVEQVSQDFEELTLHRSIAEQLESSFENGIVSIASRVLPLLNDTVRAEWLGLMANKRGSAVIVETGKLPIPLPELWELVDHFRDLAVESPVVRNRRGTSVLPIKSKEINELILLPVASSQKRIGWLIALNRVRPSLPSDVVLSEVDFEFGTHEASLMATAASIMATQASNLDLLQEREELLVRVVKTLVSAIEAKDSYTCGHSERVALYARSLGLQLGYTEEQAEKLYLTGLLHDIGKIGVSDATLKKPGRLSDDEFAEIKRHPDDGWAILNDLHQLAYVLPGVLHHHERFDGKGYPDGLVADEIPMDGRILAVADSFDAMTSDRSYRAGMPIEKAESILLEGRGTQWDDEVIDAFFAIRQQIEAIRLNYKVHKKPQRLRGRCVEVPEVSQVVDDDGKLIAWS